MASKIKIAMDPVFKRSSRRVSKKFKSVGVSYRQADSAAGVVLVSRRKKKPWEKQKAPHGKAIANMLRAKGFDPFKYSSSEKSKAVQIVQRGAARAALATFRTGRAMKARYKRPFEMAAQELAEAAQHHVRRGHKALDKDTLRQKEILSNQGRISSRNVRTYGIRTGRWVKGFRGKYKGSKRGLENV